MPRAKKEDIEEIAGEVKFNRVAERLLDEIAVYYKRIHGRDLSHDEIVSIAHQIIDSRTEHK